jgi:hypothetical protein
VLLPKRNNVVAVREAKRERHPSFPEKTAKG